MSLKTLDVAIGLTFLFLMVTFVASTLLEIAANVFRWRARMLHDAINNMLEYSRIASVHDVYDNPLIQALCQTTTIAFWRHPFKTLKTMLSAKADLSYARAKIYPSYIPAATFSAAILQAIMRRSTKPIDLSPDAAIEEIRSQLRVAPDPEQLAQMDALASILSVTLATQGGSIQAIRLAIEKWFNDAMDRASGWYKRRTQMRLLMLGLLLGFGCNIDTIGVARWLWQGDAARQSVVAVATDYAKNAPPPATNPNKDSQNKDNQNRLTPELARIIDFDRQTAALQYPIGWPVKGTDDRLWFLQYLFGAFLTAIAISMGSTFWFDALSNLIKLRGTGPKPGAR
ncbi:MAG TPA: hypothetical protein VGK01_18640 [Candidatus Angelobacter sp.]|jgi:hypothetical protein